MMFNYTLQYTIIYTYIENEWWNSTRLYWSDNRNSSIYRCSVALLFVNIHFIHRLAFVPRRNANIAKCIHVFPSIFNSISYKLFGVVCVCYVGREHRHTHTHLHILTHAIYVALFSFYRVVMAINIQKTDISFSVDFSHLSLSLSILFVGHKNS